MDLEYIHTYILCQYSHRFEIILIKGTIHLRRRQIFTIVDSLLLLSVRQIWQIFDPYPLKNCRRVKWMVPNCTYVSIVLSPISDFIKLILCKITYSD